jgi:hypothetical protein
LIKVTRSRLAVGAATLALAASGIGVTAVTATASSAGCTGATGALAGSCSDEVTASGVGWAVYRGISRAGTPVVAVANAATVTDGSTDFFANQTNGNASERTFEYAPKGVVSGLCITQASSWSNLELRHCNGGAAQQFYGLGDTQDDTSSTNGGIQWLNAASGKVVVAVKKNLVMRSLDSAASVSGSYFHWAG